MCHARRLQPCPKSGGVAPGALAAPRNPRAGGSGRGRGRRSGACPRIRVSATWAFLRALPRRACPRLAQPRGFGRRLRRARRRLARRLVSVGARDVEIPAIVSRVDHRAVEERTSVGSFRSERRARFAVPASEGLRRKEVLHLDCEIAAGPPSWPSLSKWVGEGHVETAGGPLQKAR